MSKSEKESRSTTWVFIFYEKDEIDWRAEIEEWHVKCIVSPEHNKDVYTSRDVAIAKKAGREIEYEAGDLKKSHRHGLLVFDNLKSRKQVQELIEGLGGPAEVKQVHSPNAMVRYFCHLDSPKKHQYDVKEIEGFAGINIEKYLQKDADEFSTTFREILQYVHKTNQRSWINFLMNSCQENIDWYYLCMNPKGYNLVRSIIDSQAKKHKEFTLCNDYSTNESPYVWEVYNETLELITEKDLEDLEELGEKEEESLKKMIGECEDEADITDNRKMQDDIERGADEERTSVSDSPSQKERGENEPVQRPESETAA